MVGSQSAANVTIHNYKYNLISDKDKFKVVCEVILLLEEDEGGWGLGAVLERHI